jgi:hypothetical protein
VALPVLLVCATIAGAEEPAIDARTLESTRDTLDKWVETQQIISNEKRDWQLAREVLEQRNELLQNEIATLEEKIAETQSGIGEVDVKRRELNAENRALEDAADLLDAEILGLEAKTRGLLARLPEPILERVAPLSARIPDNPANTQLSLGERYQNVVGILNEVNKFNRDITLTSEVRTLPGGSASEVRALYLGLGQAYYVTANGEAAGVGRPTSDGWKWTPANEMADEILQAIAILQNEDVPAYVPLPVEIQ